MADKTWSSLNKGEYSAITAYTVGDFVSYGGGYYTCIQNTTGNAPTTDDDNAYWNLVASKGDTGAQGDQGIQGIQGIQGETGTSFTWKGDWDSGTTYAVRDVVYQIGSSYICILGHTNQEPPNATYWELVAQKGLDGEGSGDVVGPASSVTNKIAAFDGITGKLLKDGGKTIAEVEAASIPVGYLDTDGTLAANSDTKVATQKALKTYADTKLATSAKAAGTDINTGTDDAKYVTSKAIADSKVSITDKTETLTNKTLTSPTIITPKITPRTTTEASSATPTINTDTTDMHTITALAADITSFTTNLSGTPVNGQKLIIRIKDDGTDRAITWGASFASRGATLLTTTIAGKYLYLGFIYNSTTSTWDCVAATSEA
jgi:hypothetical protein